MIKINVAILDMYNNEPNQGMRCIKELVARADVNPYGAKVSYRVYQARSKAEMPDERCDIYISSGGPGSPFDSEGTLWEEKYFSLLEALWNWNQQNYSRKKYLFFICHSFQLMARFFQLATVRERSRRSFGIIPIAKTEAGQADPLFQGLPDPFYAADFRQYEVVQPNRAQLSALGARMLAVEKERRDPELEKALMAVRISDEIVGAQFHPEADPQSMLYHFRQEERKQQVIEEYGEAKYFEMIAHLEDPENILLTRRTILPAFLDGAIRQLSGSEAPVAN